MWKEKLIVYPKDRVRHKTKPAEPYGKPGQFGVVLRVTPSGRQIPAAAYVRWDGEIMYETWERQAFLT